MPETVRSLQRRYVHHTGRILLPRMLQDLDLYRTIDELQHRNHAFV